VQAVTNRAAIEKQPQLPPVAKETWGEGFEQEFAAIEGFQEDPTQDGGVEAVGEDEAIEEGSEDNKELV